MYIKDTFLTEVHKVTDLSSLDGIHESKVVQGVWLHNVLLQDGIHIHQLELEFNALGTTKLDKVIAIYHWKKVSNLELVLNSMFNLHIEHLKTFSELSLPH